MSYLFFEDDLLFFTEVVDGQLNIIKEGLEWFCRSSGQKVNYGKSSILFSSNIPDEEAARLILAFGVTVTRSLGKYLGHPFLHQGRNVCAHKELVEHTAASMGGRSSVCHGLAE